MRQSVFITLLLCLLAGTCGRAQAWQQFRFNHEGQTVDLPTLMQKSNTPGISIALDYGGGDTTWTKTIAGQEVLPTTLFPLGAASSAPLLAAILQLVERGHLDLDAPVNNYLKRAQLPLNKGQEITVRDLMLFKIKFNVGYKPVGYAAGEKRPLFIDLIRDLKAQGIRKPEANNNYGQWLPLQLLIEDHYGEWFQTIMEREVFRPLGLNDMIYATELSPELAARAAKGHEEDGDPWPGTYQRYVAQGSHGLWSTPRDYVRFVRAMLAIQDGRTNSILQPATVEMAMTTTYGYRSLLFHVNDKGLPYWGGNAKGYFFQMQAHPEENWISAAAVNRQLNWRLGGPVLWQAGMLAKQWRSADRLGIFLQSGEENEATVVAIERYAFVNGLRCERMDARNGLPEGITATPAYVYQSPAGRAIFSGRHDSSEAVERFIRASRVSPKKTASDQRMGVLSLSRGRQTIILPIKMTAPSGENAPSSLPASVVTVWQTSLAKTTGFQPTPSVNLSALDRRLYLDVHPYRRADGKYQFTYALFSQFNCHEPVFTSFGEPVLVEEDGRGVAILTKRIAADLRKMLVPAAGFVPAGLPASVPVRSWAQLGWTLDAAILAAQETATAATPVAINGPYRVTLTKENPPGLYFSFPAPLDRYAGEINELTATFTFSEQGQRLSGRVDLPVDAISTGSGSLDTYVLGDILKSKKYPTASLVFQDVNPAANWTLGVSQSVTIPATLTVRGKQHPVTITATFTPREDGQLAITADFGLDFKKVFNKEGPDGPEEVRRQLGFTAQLLLTPLGEVLQAEKK